MASIFGIVLMVWGRYLVFGYLEFQGGVFVGTEIACTDSRYGYRYRSL